MEKKIRVYSYSSFNDYTVTDKGDNWSRVVSKMVQLAGRYCERYASDIVYDCKSFIVAIEEKRNFDRFLFVRESGVTALSPEDLLCFESIEYLQAWHLTYNAETEEQKLERVSVSIDNRWW